jgi:hypothetical protein
MNSMANDGMLLECPEELPAPASSKWAEFYLKGMKSKREKCQIDRVRRINC